MVYWIVFKMVKSKENSVLFKPNIIISRGCGSTSKVGGGHNPKRARMEEDTSFQKRAHLPFVQKVGEGALAPNAAPITVVINRGYHHVKSYHISYSVSRTFAAC